LAAEEVAIMTWVNPPKLEPTDVGSLTQLTMSGMRVATCAVSTAADALGSGDSVLYEKVHDCERQLDLLDREIDERLTAAIVEAPANAVRELLACMKLITDLERIGDLLAGFATRGPAVGSRLEMRDTGELIKMASVLEQMLLKVQRAFYERDLDMAVSVLRADAEVDRLRNLIYVRLVEGHEGVSPAGVHVLFMAQALERVGDHIKNLAEEVCHVLSGHTLRHVLRAHDQPMEQMFLRWLRGQHGLSVRAWR
jgi:phosphate transport system protein